MFFKNKYKIHNKVKKLQELTIKLKKTEEEYRELKNRKFLKPYNEYIVRQTHLIIGWDKIDVLKDILSTLIEYGDDYALFSSDMYYNLFKEVLPEGKEKEYLRNLGEFLINCADRGEIFQKKEKEIEDLKKQIEKIKNEINIY